MKLTLKRFQLLEKCTIGKLLIDGADTGIYTLEDKVREGPKVYGETAIPYGTYEVVVDYSEHFGRQMPHVLNVPGFEGIRIHPGNTAKDTEGCILVGKAWGGGDLIGRAREAFDELYPLISNAKSVTLEVS